MRLPSGLNASAPTAPECPLSPARHCQEPVSHTAISPEACPPAIRLRSGLYAAETIAAGAPASVGLRGRALDLSPSQTDTPRSAVPTSSRVPSGVNPSQVTAAGNLPASSAGCPVFAFQIRTAPSGQPAARRLPSGLNANAATGNPSPRQLQTTLLWLSQTPLWLSQTSIDCVF